ncbi:MAG: rod shape-determining protein MreD [Rhodothermales bacterium]|nr:rod shape-determining protein MreD [Rhodothermales bacterium]
MPVLLRIALTGLIAVLLQWIVLGRLRLWGAYPDGVLIFIAWLGFAYGRRTGAVSGFAFGFLMDVIYGTWGIQMFVKTGVGFMVGFFQNPDQRDMPIVRPPQAFLMALVIALLHNGLLVALLVLQSGSRDISIVFSHWIGAAVYTAVVANIAARFVTR